MSVCPGGCWLLPIPFHMGLFKCKRVPDLTPAYEHFCFQVNIFKYFFGFGDDRWSAPMLWLPRHLRKQKQVDEVQNSPLWTIWVSINAIKPHSKSASKVLPQGWTAVAAKGKQNGLKVFNSTVKFQSKDTDRSVDILTSPFASQPLPSLLFKANVDLASAGRKKVCRLYKVRDSYISHDLKPAQFS